MSIPLIAERAGIAESEFGSLFPERRSVLVGLFLELSAELATTPDPWLDGAADEDARAQLAESVAALVAVFREHGRLLDAFAAEATQDREFGQMYQKLGARLATAVARRVARGIEVGGYDGPELEEMATALIWMNERYLRLRFGRKPLGDPDAATTALSEIWVRVVYGAGD